MTNYILKGHIPVLVSDAREWMLWYANFENRIVARTDFEGITVSTVFLGIEHFNGLFETMIFWEGNAFDNWQERYYTWEEAEAGHARAVQLVNEVLNG